VKHLLVTNDFPPKLGGIQTYLWELWRRLPADEVAVLARRSSEGDDAWDRAQPFRVERWASPVMAPTNALRRRVQRMADDHGADLVIIDPLSPTSLVGPRLDRPFGIIVHGAEVTIPASVPGYQLLVRKALREASVVVAAGTWPATAAYQAAGRPLPTVIVPPGVDHRRFRPYSSTERVEARRRLGIAEDALVVASVSRLVPRKGMDVTIEAVAQLADRHPRLELVIAGEGRDRTRLEGFIASTGAPARLLGRLDDDGLVDLYGCADVFAMLCRNRWAGLEQEGFGIVFLEAAAVGVPAVAGASGGAAEAVDDGITGVVVSRPTEVEAVTEAVGGLLDDPVRRSAMGSAARRRAVSAFDEHALASQLQAGLEAAVAGELALWTPARIGTTGLVPPPVGS
jgi:phosphatidylinositol alpha-1,6-mannosyltransferase